MNFISQFNYFMQKDLEYSFTPNEVAVYMRLLHMCNSLTWKNPFNLGVDKLMVQMGLKTQKPLDTARLRLRAAGLIEFRNGNGRGKTTEYTLLCAPERGAKNYPLYAVDAEPIQPAAGPETPTERGSKNIPLSGTLSADSLETPPERGQENIPHKGGTTINYTKPEQGEAVASAPAPKSGKAGPAKKPSKAGATEEEIAALALPFTGTEFADLWSTFRRGSKQAKKELSAFELMLKKLNKYPEAFAVAMLEAAIQGGWSGVENPGTPRAYEEWLAQQAKAPLPAPTGAQVGPELNLEFIAEQEAEDARERAEHFARFSTHAA